MLQKEFFNTSSFNPSPYWDNNLINLTGAQKWDNDTVFYPGKYRVSMNAGSNVCYGSDGSIIYFGKPVIIEKDIIVTKKFIIRAYCGGKSYVSVQSNSRIIGTNPYSGTFKVNGVTDAAVSVPSVSHIFGNAGSAGFYTSTGTSPLPTSIASSGNCLGDGVGTDRGSMRFSASSAGSCIHFLPVDGIFGTDYLYAFHSAGVAGMGYYIYGGGGSAYGGAASGGSINSSSTLQGGSTLYGIGGLGVSNSAQGNNGTGIGNGKNGFFGAGAFFDGQSWHDETTYADSAVDGKIQVTYLGPVNL